MVKCYNCGGPHLMKDCPDKRHPSFPGAKSFFKGKSSYMTESLYGMYQNKGKGKKGKGKSKFSHWTDLQDPQWSLAMSEGKMKGKGTRKPSRPPLNVYAMD